MPLKSKQPRIPRLAEPFAPEAASALATLGHWTDPGDRAVLSAVDSLAVRALCLPLEPGTYPIDHFGAAS